MEQQAILNLLRELGYKTDHLTPEQLLRLTQAIKNQIDYFTSKK